ncbi:MAG: crt 6, partial [Mycobacterium sp.]|nr:crt 6 [Mycobacterium sp.]
MSTEPIGFRFERDAAVTTVVLDHGRVNIVDPELIEALIEHLPTVLDDPSVRCIVIRGKDRIFVGGANLKVMRNLDPDTYRAMRRWTVVQRLLELAPKPVIAALNGHALGGGAELALACDLRILHAEATFGFPETGLGIFPGAGGSQRLPRLIGPHRAKRLIIDATRLSADEALREG